MNWFGTTDKKVYGGVRRKKLFKAWPPPLPTDDDLVEGWDARQQSAWATPGGESEHDDETVQGGLGLGGDINWLRDVMVRSCVSNFGQIVVPIPIRWHLSRRFRLLSWCTNFGASQVYASHQSHTHRLSMHRHQRASLPRNKCTWGHRVAYRPG